MTENINWRELSADEAQPLASLDNKIREWGSRKEGGTGEIDRRARVIGALLGWELNKEDKIGNIVDKLVGIEWSESPSENVVTLLCILEKADEDVDVAASIASRFGGKDRHMDDKVLARKLGEAGINYTGDPGFLKLAIYILRKLDDNGEIAADQLDKTANNFALRAHYWLQKSLGKKPEEVRGIGHSKWDPSPMSVDYLSDFVERVLEYGKEY